MILFIYVLMEIEMCNIIKKSIIIIILNMKRSFV